MKRSNLWIAGAVAAMFAGSCHGAIADTTDNSSSNSTTISTPSSTTSTTTTTTTVPVVGDTPSDATMNSNPYSTSNYTSSTVDYSLLTSKHLDYLDLQQAKASGLSDTEVATIAKIADKADVPFNEVRAAVDRGETFAFITQDYGLNYGDVLDVNDEKDRIANYQMAYENTGEASLRNPNGSLFAHMQSDNDMSSQYNMADKDIVDILSSSRRFSILTRELQIAGLTDTLNGASSFTLFAPTDRAFSKLPAGTLDTLNSNPDRLRAVLAYHVIPARVTASTAMAMTSPTSPATVEGDTLQVTTNNNDLYINGTAKVVKADIMAANGVIHVINQVLMPPAGATLAAMGTTSTTSSTTTTTTQPSNLIAAPTSTAPAASTTTVTAPAPDMTAAPSSTTTTVTTPGPNGAPSSSTTVTTPSNP